MEPKRLNRPREIADSLVRRMGWPKMEPLKIVSVSRGLQERVLGRLPSQAISHESHAKTRLKDEDISQGPIVPSSGSRSWLDIVTLVSLVAAAVMMVGIWVGYNRNKISIPTVSDIAEVQIDIPSIEPNQTPSRTSRFIARSMEDVISYLTQHRTKIKEKAIAHLSSYGVDSKVIPVELSEQELATIRTHGIGRWVLDISGTEMPFVVLTPEMRLVCNPKGSGGCYLPGTNIVFVAELSLPTRLHEFTHNAYDLNNRGFIYTAPSDRRLKFTWIPENLYEGATELAARRATGVNDHTAYARYTRSALMLEAIDFTEFYLAFMYGDWIKFQQKVDILFGKNTFQNILELAELGTTNDGYLRDSEDASANCALSRYLISKFSESQEGRKLLAQVKQDPLWDATFEPKCNGR